ncbi:MAG: alcohol dehydrogenase catalytic domain-containing protein [Thermoleophilia bacterium]|nr:alcohol dehydrogenase catalytic domain-containing protein [Thermoleophilia bacterium]
MRALVWHGGTALTVDERPEPVAREGEVVLDVELAGICGSDLHPYRGHPGPRVPPLVLGHEAVGSVQGRPERYAVFPLVVCGSCSPCLRGEENLCARRGLLGLDRDGVFAERVAVDEDALLPLPPGVDERAAVLVEPLAASVSVLRLDRVEAGDHVVVLGGGPIGLLAVWASALRGAEVTCVEPLEQRRALAGRLGAETLLAGTADVPEGRADVAIDAVGVEETWRAGIAGVRPGGRVALVGLGQAEGAVPAAELVRRGVTLRGHYAYTRADFEAALVLLADSPPPLDWLTPVPLERGGDGFHRLVSEPDVVTKVLLSVPRR